MKKKKKTGLWVGLLLVLAVVGILPLHEQQSDVPAAQEHTASYAIESQADTSLSEAANEASLKTSQAVAEAQETTLDTAQSVVADTQQDTETTTEVQSAETAEVQTLSVADIPTYTGDAAVILNDNKPFFTDAEYTTEAFESYSDLDSLGRCGVAYANVCEEIMPTEERGAIGMIKPSGWHTIKYDCVDGKYLYNRCHLIGYQLSGENANEKNLITGTRYLNVTGMLPYEDQVADYVHDTDNHVLYRVTPVFTGNNLVADGVEIEAASVEDKGASLQFHVFCYNVQPGVVIDYATGDSHLTEDSDAQTAAKMNTATAEKSSMATEQTVTEQTAADKAAARKTEVTAAADTEASGSTSAEPSKEITYVLNKNTHKFHYPSCSSADDIKPKNRKEFTGTREEVIAQGYDPCKRCNP